MALNLGDITFALGTDTTGLDKAAQKLVSFSQKVDQAARTQTAGAQAVADAYKKQESSITSALNKVLNLNAQIARSGVNGASMMNQASAAFDKYTNTLTRGAVSALAFQRANERLSLSLGGVQRQFNASKGSANSFGDFGKLGDLLKVVASSAVLVTGPLGGVASRLTAFAAIVRNDNLAIAGFVAAIAVGAGELDKLGKAALNAGKQVDEIKGGLSTITGGGTIGGQSFNDLSAIADKSGYKIQDLAEQWQNFAQVTKDSAMAGQAGEEVFSQLAVVMGNLRRSPEQVAGALRTMQTMLDNNTVSAMQLKRQLGTDLPGAFQEAQKAMGFSGANGTANFTNAMKKNQIQPDTMLPKMMEQYIQDLHIGSGAVDTYTAAQNRLHNSNLLFLNDLDKSLSISAGAEAGYKLLADVVKGLDSALTHAGPVVKSITSGFLTFASVGATLLAVGKAAEIAGAALAALGVSFGGLALLTPPGWVVGLVAILVAATAAIYTYMHASNEASTAVQDTTKATNDYLKALKDVGGATNMAVFAGNSQWQAQKKAVEDATKALADFEKQQEILGANRASAGLPLKIDSDVLNSWHALKNELADAQKALNALQGALGAKGTKQSFGINDDQARKFQQSHDSLQEMNNEMSKGTQALSGGNGLEAYKRLNEQFADNKKVLEYAKSLNALPPAYREGLLSVDQYREGLLAMTAAMDKAKLDEGAMKDLQQGVASSFSIVGDAIKELATTGKLNFATLSAAAESAAADIINQFMKLAVLNPLMNMIFSQGGTSGQLPVLGGTGNLTTLGTASGLGGIGGLANMLGFQAPAVNYGTEFGPAMIPGFAKGGAFNNGIRFLADGGILNGPTAFNTSSGIAIGGEAGTEAVMPLVRGPGGKLGVANHGGAGAVNVYVNTPNMQSFSHPSSQNQIATQMRKAVMQASRNQ